jgi:hypothetical protein
MDNVKGTTWGYNTMMTSGTMGWEHGTLSFDDNGVGHMTGIVRNEIHLPDRGNIPYTMSLSGMVGSAGPVSSALMTFLMNGGVMSMSGTGGGMGGGMMGGGMMTATFHGIMNGARNLMVSNYSDGSGGYPFSIQMK